MIFLLAAGGSSSLGTVQDRGERHLVWRWGGGGTGTVHSPVVLAGQAGGAQGGFPPLSSFVKPCGIAGWPMSRTVNFVGFLFFWGQ